MGQHKTPQLHGFEHGKCMSYMAQSMDGVVKGAYVVHEDDSQAQVSTIEVGVELSFPVAVAKNSRSCQVCLSESSVFLAGDFLNSNRSSINEVPWLDRATAMLTCRLL